MRTKGKSKLCERCGNHRFTGSIENKDMVFHCRRCGAVWMIWDPDTALRDFSDYFTIREIGIGVGTMPIKK